MIDDLDHFRIRNEVCFENGKRSIIFKLHVPHAKDKFFDNNFLIVSVYTREKFNNVHVLLKYT